MRTMYHRSTPLIAAIVAAVMAVVYVSASTSPPTSGNSVQETPSPTATPTAATATSTPTPSTSPTPFPSPSPISTVSPSELPAQRAKWNAAAITSYRYVLQTLCFCGPATVQPFTVTVQSNTTKSVADEQGQFISLSDPAYSLVAKFATIDALFTEVERLSTVSYYRAEVTYDATYGFPARIASDPAQFIADDELTIVVRDFQILKPDSLPRMGGRP